MALAALALGLALLAAPLTASAGEALSQGSFTGKSDHVASGSVEVVQTENGLQVILGEDFNFDGAPDPKLGFGKNGYDKSTKFSALKSNSGKQTYNIPESIDGTAYDEVWIWCEKYSVPLGVAKLKP